MNETLMRLIEANRAYAESSGFCGNVSEKRREETASAQKPYAVIVTCSDSRVIPEAIFSAGIGELFVIRTAGNVIGASETASILYAVRHLHTDTVVILGHTCCGAVNAALHGEFEGAVGVVTKRIKNAVGDETDPYRACVKNVRQGVADAEEALCGAGVAVVGAIYDIQSGKVAILDN